MLKHNDIHTRTYKQANLAKLTCFFFNKAPDWNVCPFRWNEEETPGTCKRFSTLGNITEMWVATLVSWCGWIHKSLTDKGQGAVSRTFTTVRSWVSAEVLIMCLGQRWYHLSDPIFTKTYLGSSWLPCRFLHEQISYTSDLSHVPSDKPRNWPPTHLPPLHSLGGFTLEVIKDIFWRPAEWKSSRKQLRFMSLPS